MLDEMVEMARRFFKISKETKLDFDEKFPEMPDIANDYNNKTEIEDSNDGKI